jgi:hypothetical protein
MVAKIVTFARWKNKPIRNCKLEVYKVYLLQDDSIRDLYKKSLQNTWLQHQ